MVGLSLFIIWVRPEKWEKNSESNRDFPEKKNKRIVFPKKFLRRIILIRRRLITKKNKQKRI